MESIKINKYLSAFIACCVCAAALSALAFVVALNNPATGYELSIYSSTPLAVWILLTVSYFLCITLLIQESTHKDQSNRWIIALALLMINSMLILEMSAIRGYYTIGGDALMHIGYIRDMSNGIISDKNMYPIIHIGPAILVKAGLAPSVALSLSPVLWYLIYVASGYKLVSYLWKEKSKVIIASTLIALPMLPHGVGIVAVLLGASTFPLVLLVVIGFHQTHSWTHRLMYIAGYVVLWITMALLYPVALEATVICFGVGFIILRGNRWEIPVLIIVAAVTVWWYEVWYNMQLAGDFIADILRNTSPSERSAMIMGTPDGYPAPVVFNPEQQVVDITEQATLLPTMTGIEDTQTMGSYNGVALILLRFGSAVVLGIIATWNVLTAKLSWKTPRTLFISLFVIFNLMWLTGWYLQLNSFSAALTRIMYWVPTLSILLVVPLVHRMHKSILIAGLMILAISSSTVVYASPITGVSSAQITQQEMTGMRCLLKNSNKETYIVFLNHQRVSRYVAAIYGVERVRQEQRYYWLTQYEPSRGLFSYNDFSSLGDKYLSDVYLVITKSDRVLPRWEEDRLYLVESDPAARLIYRYGDEFEVWYVKGNK